MGVNVDDFHGVKEEHHKWDGAGKDTYKAPTPTKVEWHKLHSAQWAWNNHAMKSQGWDPEGKLNKDLMLGVTWNDTHPSPLATSFADNFVTKKEYAKQLEPRHELSDIGEADHFADWKWNESKNLRLLYGSSGSFYYRVNNTGEHDEDWAKDEWDMGDQAVDKVTAAHQLNARSDMARTGDPLRDVGAGWPMTNMVGSDVHSITGDFGDKFPDASAAASPPLAIERAGVKVAAYSLPETVEGKATAGRGAALGLQGGREARVGLRGGSRLMELARQEQLARRGRGQRREMEKEEMYEKQQRRLLEGEKLKRHTWLLQNEQRQKLIRKQQQARDLALQQQQDQAKRMRQRQRVKLSRGKVRRSLDEAAARQGAAGGGRHGAVGGSRGPVVSAAPLVKFAREMSVAGLSLPKGSV